MFSLKSLSRYDLFILNSRAPPQAKSFLYYQNLLTKTSAGIKKEKIGDLLFIFRYKGNFIKFENEEPKEDILIIYIKTNKKEKGTLVLFFTLRIPRMNYPRYLHDFL